MQPQPHLNRIDYVPTRVSIPTEPRGGTASPAVRLSDADDTKTGDGEPGDSIRLLQPGRTFAQPSMAYLIFSNGVEELDRCQLTRAAVVGRSPECDVSVHDILLSRKHCRLEPDGDHAGGEHVWAVVDLQSKNGTFVGDERVTGRRRLSDGDIVCVGKTRITFHTGSFIPAPRNFRHDRPRRPVDPGDALAGTVSGMEYVEPAPPEMSQFSFPTPQPRPQDPAAFARDDIYSMINEIASSSWDSIYALNARPVHRTRTLPRPMIRTAGQVDQLPVAPPQRPRVSMSLQLAPASIVDAHRPAMPVAAASSPSPLVAHDREVARRSAMERMARSARARLVRMRRWMNSIAQA